jgi:hypothetical protein
MNTSASAAVITIPHFLSKTVLKDGIVYEITPNTLTVRLMQFALH